jgi:TPP-dependent indolepyruvate ferredoxin oxidoreductase alpha subunit
MYFEYSTNEKSGSGGGVTAAVSGLRSFVFFSTWMNVASDPSCRWVMGVRKGMVIRPRMTLPCIRARTSRTAASSLA